MRRIFYTIFAVFTSFNLMAQCPPTVGTRVDFQWDPNTPSATSFGPFSTHGTKQTSFTVNTVLVTVKVLDPDNRLTISNYTSEVSSLNGTAPFSNVVTKDNGIYGNGYFTLGMFTENNNESVALEYTFSQPVYLCNLEISDIDYETAPGSTPNGYVTYQDEVDIAAYNDASNIPVTISKAAVYTPLTITGQNILADYDLFNTNGDVSSNSEWGKVFLNTALPIKRIVITYTNGPTDDGKSNDHAIRIGGILGAIAPIGLPVTINNFTAFEKNNKVQAVLNVTNETNIVSYSLQRLQETNNWVALDKINASRSNTYSFMDALPKAGANQYRIAILHQDGSTTYSALQMVKITSAKNFFVFYNNKQLLLKANSEVKQAVTVQISNSQGLQIYNKSIQLNEGLNQINLDNIPLIAKGIFLVRISNKEGTLFTTKVLE